MKTVVVIHTKITLQNIMVVNHKETPLRVKLTDFHSAIKAAEVTHCNLMHKGEVTLDLTITETADMWSMVETLGQLEDQILDDGTQMRLYYSQKQDSTKPVWLKTADEHKAVTGFPPQNHRGSSRFSSLDDLVMLYPEAEKIREKTAFVHLLKQMTHLNHQNRFTPSEALSHCFINMSQGGG
ncbi:homeodomain-interacting protein kinase 2-like isoform X3 [Scomber scombrus]|uniref:Homeodomain-interacting protein kinase 2-like isoform X3 n=1 Tax=Scomber scombrus TaxID=13677 RepID=A0AAV1P6I9_SCOSC